MYWVFPLFLSLNLQAYTYLHLGKDSSLILYYLGKSVRSGVPCLTSYIITWLHLFYLEKIELFMLVHMHAG